MVVARSAATAAASLVVPQRSDEQLWGGGAVCHVCVGGHPWPSSGSGRVGVANHGLHCQHGLYLEADRDYVGFTYLRAPSHPGGAAGQAVEVEVTLEDSVTGRVLARQTLAVPSGQPWHQLELSLHTAGGGSVCGGVRRPDPQSGTQWLSQCSGALVIAVRTASTILDVDLTYLSPAAWGLLPGAWGVALQDPSSPIRTHTHTAAQFGDAHSGALCSVRVCDAAPHAGTLGLPARRDVAEMFRSQHLKTLRMGGSMCNHGPYRWKDFRGPRDQRTPYHGDWYRQVCVVRLCGCLSHARTLTADSPCLVSLCVLADPDPPCVPRGGCSLGWCRAAALACSRSVSHAVPMWARAQVWGWGQTPRGLP